MAGLATAGTMNRTDNIGAVTGVTVADHTRKL